MAVTLPSLSGRQGSRDGIMLERSRWARRSRRVEVSVQPRVLLGFMAVFQGLGISVQSVEGKSKALGTHCDFLHFFYFIFPLCTSQTFIS